MALIEDIKLWTALITPMDQNGDVHYGDLEKLVRAQEEARNGLLVLGSTGESLNLDLEEKKKIVEFVVSLKPNVPIMVGVGGVNLRTTSAWVEYLEEQKIDAYLMVTPLYAKPGPIGQKEWFKTLMDKVSRPVMLYNIPGRTGIELYPETLRGLVSHPRLWALKEASGSKEKFAEYVRIMGDKPVFSGDDPLLPNYAPLGAKGLVSVAGNVWPKQTNRYVQLTLNNELTDRITWQKAGKALFCASNPIPVKRLMNELGQIETPILRAPLDRRDLDDASQLLKENENIDYWMSKNS